MFNIEQELECSNSSYEARDPKIEDGMIEARLFWDGTDYGHHYFNAETGVTTNWHPESGEENPFRLRKKSGTRAATRFYLTTGKRDWPKDDWVRVTSLPTMEDGAEAADRMKELNQAANDTGSDFRYLVKRETEEVPDHPWREWMRQRFETGEYQPVPWENEDWYQPFKDKHFTHLSIVDEFSVAYVHDEEAGQSDRNIRTTPGRYLTQFFSDVLSPAEIQAWALKVDTECELKFAHTPDEIERVYTGGVHSCMAYSFPDNGAWNPNLPFHPVRIYGAGDLAVAYLERKGKISARALCWPEKKIYGRMYGDEQRLQAMMTEAGYSADVSCTGFTGARLNLHLHEDDPDVFVAPYMDHSYGAKIEGDTLVMVGGLSGVRINCTRTDGWCNLFNDDDDYDACEEGDCYCCGYCDRCGDREALDDMWTVDGGDHRYCDQCGRSHATECDWCNDYWADDGPLSCVSAFNANDLVRPVGSICPDCRDDTANAQLYQGVLVDADTLTQCDSCDEYRPNEQAECACETSTQLEMEAA